MLAPFKIFLVLGMAVLALGMAGRTFWVQDVQYALPTPVPAAWKDAPRFIRPALPYSLVPRPLQRETRPVLLHFFNAECPCSRFNLDQVRALVRHYRTLLRCVTVMEAADTAQARKDFKNLPVGGEYVTDTDGKIAAACGVYSTPQAVVLDASGRLMYRGNFNAGRYCNSPESEYVRLTLDALLAHRTLPPFPAAATRSYGCTLPANRTTTESSR